MNYRLSNVLLTLVIVFLIVGCATEQNATGQSNPDERTAENKYTPPRKPPPAPEPVESPPLKEKAAGKVVEVGPGPEGLAADPGTGLVAVGLRNPARLALVDGENGQRVREVELPASPRHLDLAGPSGPVLVPAERSDSLVQVGLPEGGILAETPVGTFPHGAASAPNGRIFVINEKQNTASVIEGRRVIETLDTPLQPGGVAVTGSGLVGVVGVRGLALEVYDSNTLKSLGRINAGDGPTHVRAGPRNRFYVTDTRGGAILIYETQPELRQIGRIGSLGSPYGIAIDPRRNQLWVTLTAENRVVQYALDGDTPGKIASYSTVRQPNSVDVDPSSGRVFVAGSVEGKLQILNP